MLSTNQHINKLILKWANDIHGTWKDVEKDLEWLIQQIQSETPTQSTEEEHEEVA